jgi:hypothetical protein
MLKSYLCFEKETEIHKVLFFDLKSHQNPRKRGIYNEFELSDANLRHCLTRHLV